MHTQKKANISPGKNQVNGAAATSPFYIQSFICVLSSYSGNYTMTFRKTQEFRHPIPTTFNLQLLSTFFLLGHIVPCETSITSSLQSQWESEINYFFQQYVAQEGASCTSTGTLHRLQLSERRHFKYQLSASSCANYFTSSCLLPLALFVSTQYLDYKFFQARILILTLCTLKPYVCQSVHIKSKLILVFISLTYAMILGISTKHKMLLQKKNPTAMLRMTMGT